MWLYLCMYLFLEKQLKSKKKIFIFLSSKYILWLFFFFFTEPTGMQSFLTTALHLTGGESKEKKDTPNPFLCSVLRALAIQGELHKKLKLFGNNNNNIAYFFHFN